MAWYVLYPVAHSSNNLLTLLACRDKFPVMIGVAFLQSDPVFSCTDFKGVGRAEGAAWLSAAYHEHRRLRDAERLWDEFLDAPKLGICIIILRARAPRVGWVDRCSEPTASHQVRVFGPDYYLGLCIGSGKQHFIAILLQLGPWQL